jgi:hypothetical protein
MMMPRIAFLAALLAGAQSAVVPDVADVTIKTRRTNDRSPGVVITETLELKGARQRRDELVQSPRGLASRVYGRITQCDQRQMLLLNHEAKTYAYEPLYVPVPSSQAASSHAMALGPTITMTVDAVDTGERKRFGRYVARHVITTRTVERGSGDVTVGRLDGWYIDVPEPNCQTAERTAALIATGTPNVVVKRKGDARRGYPIEETYRFSGQHPIAGKTELIELSEAPLDDARFTVPAGYRMAMPSPFGGFDLSKPDTIGNRLQSYREVMAAWVDYFRRAVTSP